MNAVTPFDPTSVQPLAELVGAASRVSLVVGADGRISHVAGAPWPLLGLTAELALGRRVDVLVTEADHELMRELLGPDGAAFGELELRFNRQNASGNPLLLVSSATLPGMPGSVLLTASDPHTGRAIDAALRNAGRVSHALAARSPLVVFHLDSEGRMIAINAEWATISGQPSNEALDLGWLSQVHDDDRAGLFDLANVAHQANRGWRHTVRIIHATLGASAVDIAAAPIMPDGTLAGYVGVFVAHERPHADASEAPHTANGTQNSSALGSTGTASAPQLPINLGSALAAPAGIGPAGFAPVLALDTAFGSIAAPQRAAAHQPPVIPPAMAPAAADLAASARAQLGQHSWEPQAGTATLDPVEDAKQSPSEPNAVVVEVARWSAGTLQESPAAPTPTASTTHDLTPDAPAHAPHEGASRIPMARDVSPTLPPSVRVDVRTPEPHSPVLAPFDHPPAVIAFDPTPVPYDHTPAATPVDTTPMSAPPSTLAVPTEVVGDAAVTHQYESGHFPAPAAPMPQPPALAGWASVVPAPVGITAAPAPALPPFGVDAAAEVSATEGGDVIRPGEAQPPGTGLARVIDPNAPQSDPAPRSTPRPAASGALPLDEILARQAAAEQESGGARFDPIVPGLADFLSDAEDRTTMPKAASRPETTAPSSNPMWTPGAAPTQPHPEEVAEPIRRPEPAAQRPEPAPGASDQYGALSFDPNPVPGADELTGLANRTLFHLLVEDALLRLREEGVSVAIFTFDLIGFRELATSCGVKLADDYFFILAKRIESTIRGVDTAGRVGEHDMAVLVVGWFFPGDLENIARRFLRKLVEQLPSRSGEAVNIGACLGGALGNESDDANTIMRRSFESRALARAKGSGQGEINFGSHLAEITV